MEKLITIDGVQYRCTPVDEQEQQPKRWGDDENQRIDGYYIDTDSEFIEISDAYNEPENYNIFATKKLAKKALAMARISQKMKNDERFGGVVTDEEWKRDEYKYVYHREEGHIRLNCVYTLYHFLAFHTEEQADLFLQENEDLVKNYLMLD